MTKSSSRLFPIKYKYLVATAAAIERFFAGARAALDERRWTQYLVSRLSQANPHGEHRKFTGAEVHGRVENAAAAHYA
jgi:hypothetical protein